MSPAHGGDFITPHMLPIHNNLNDKVHEAVPLINEVVIGIFWQFRLSYFVYITFWQLLKNVPLHFNKLLLVIFKKCTSAFLS
jgi:hypothetical protein